MRSLKITLLVLVVLFLTVSGQSSDVVVENDQPTYKTHKQYDLMAHAKKKAEVATQG